MECLNHATCVDRRHDQWRRSLLPANAPVQFFKVVNNVYYESKGQRRFRRFDESGEDQLKDEDRVFVGIKLR
jgi:hypothetical protein